MSDEKEQGPFFRLATPEEVMAEIAQKVSAYADLAVRRSAGEIKAMAEVLTAACEGQVQDYVLVAQELPGGRRAVFLKRKADVEGLE